MKWYGEGMNQEWVEAGVQAVADERRRVGLHGGDSQIVRVAIAAVEPLIRADERERIAVWPNTRAFIEDEVRAQIAADIEALADDWSDWSALVQTNGDLSELRDVVKDAIHDAARIARGES